MPEHNTPLEMSDSFRAAAGGLILPSEQEVQPCPRFLYTSLPMFPWSPKILGSKDIPTSSGRSNKAVYVTPGANRSPKEPAMFKDSKLEEACRICKECIYLEGELSPPAVAALEYVLASVVSGSSLSSMTTVMARSGLINLPEACIHPVMCLAVSASSSHARCCCAAEWILLPVMLGLKGPPTQGLNAAIAYLGEISPQALAEHCFSHLLSPSAMPPSVTLSNHQAELIVKSIKIAIPKHLLHTLIAAAGGGASPQNISLLWSEHTITVMQAIIDARPVIPSDSAVLVLLTSSLHRASKGLASSVKFGKLMLATTKAYGSQFRDNKQCRSHMNAAAEANTTFMRKIVKSALEALDR